MGAPSSTSWLKKLISPDRLAPDPVLARDQWLEIFLIPLIGIAVGWWISADDPMLAQSHFPWLWFAPVLVALRYGVSPGLLSSIPLIINWLIANAMGRVEDAFAFRFFFGAGVLVMVCGEFSDVWRDRNARMEETYLYVTERLSRLTKRHLLLNLSHDRLEQEMLIRPGSLRDALARLRGAKAASRCRLANATPSARAKCSTPPKGRCRWGCLAEGRGGRGTKCTPC